jgi:site-specific DNA-methyltransferase (adenine-specific)
MVDPVLMSSKSEYWCTPEKVLAPVRSLAGGQIALDPCANGYSTVGAVEEWSPPEHDGLSEDWTKAAQGGLVFVNPPYGRKTSLEWTRKIIKEAAKGCNIVALLPARTDTKWFHALYALRNGSPIACFIKGRLRFIEGLTGKAAVGAPFPSVLLYLGSEEDLFCAHVKHLGLILV